MRSKRIISYKYFTDVFDFEEWQKAEEIEIIGITPLVPYTFVSNEKETTELGHPFISRSEIEHGQGIFVTHAINVEIDEDE